MKNIFDIAKLITKEKVGHITDEENQQLNNWKEVGEAEVNAYNKASDPKKIQKQHDLYSQINHEKQWSRITNQIPELVERPIIKLRNVLKWAAIFLLPLLASTYLLNEVYWNKEQVIVEAGSPKASLKLSNGKTIYLEDYQGKEIKSGRKKLAVNNDNKLVYDKGSSVNEVLEFNTIETPIKGEYSMILSDGTRVRLNAQTQLEYPVKFGNGKREVHLKGEAYFDVAKDTARPFVVHVNNGSDVEVLGTQFNVMAYEDDTEVQTTLIEGKVKFSYKEDEVTLLPGEQSALNNLTNEVFVKEVDTYKYTAWIHGKFVFDKEELGSVLRKMSRWYGVEVNCDNNEILTRRISGMVDKYENIDKLISLIEEVSPIEINLDQNTMFVAEK